MKKIILIILLLFSIHFWRFAYLPQYIHNGGNLLSLLIMGFAFIRVMQKDGMLFKNAIILFLIGIVINIISAYINQGQHPWHTFLAFGSFYFIIFYFFLHDLNISQKFLIKIIIIFAIFYSIFYIIQFMAFPKIIFYSNMVEDRGTIRLRIEGNGFLVLAYFVLFNRFLLNRRMMDILLALGFFIILFMGGFRTLTFAVLLLSGIMYIKLTRLSASSIAILALIILLFIGLFQFQKTSNILNEMISITKETVIQGVTDIRIRTLHFFFNEFPSNKSVYIFGAGIPGFPSSYFYSMNALERYYGYYWVDLGMIGFYIIVGMVALIGLLWYAIKALIIKLPPEKNYLNFYFAYLLIVSFTTMEIFRAGVFAVEAIALYLIDKSIENEDIIEPKSLMNLTT